MDKQQSNDKTDNQSFDMTSKFSTQSKLNEIDQNKLKSFTNNFKFIVNHAHKKYHNESINNIIQNAQNEDKDIFDGKKNSLKEKVLQSLKRSNSFVGDSPFLNSISNTFLETKKSIFLTPGKTPKIEEKSSFDVLTIFNLENPNKEISKSSTNIVYFQSSKNLISNKPPDFHTKIKKFVEKKEKKIKNLKDKILEVEMQNFKTTPGIDYGSIRIINGKLKDKKPLYLRYEDVKKEKNTKIESYKKNLIRNNSAIAINTNFAEFPLNINENNKNNINSVNIKNLNINNLIYNNDQINNTPGRAKTLTADEFNKWLEKNDKWRKNKEEKKIYRRKSMDDIKLETEKTSHKPNINKLSDIIANTKNFNEFPGVEIYEKLYHLKDLKIQRQKLLEEKNKPNFTPTINNYKPKYLYQTKNNNHENDFSSSNTVVKIKNPKDHDYFIKDKQVILKEIKKMGEKLSKKKTCNKQKNGKFKINLHRELSSNSTKNLLDDKERIKIKSDLTFFEQNEHNKLIFYK